MRAFASPREVVVLRDSIQLPVFPALKRWAKLGRPFRAGFAEVSWQTLRGKPNLIRHRRAFPSQLSSPPAIIPSLSRRLHR